MLKSRARAIADLWREDTTRRRMVVMMRELERGRSYKEHEDNRAKCKLVVQVPEVIVINLTYRH